MRHFPFLHTWRPVKTYHYIDSSWGGSAQSTKVTMMCDCGRLKEEMMYNCGFIELSDLIPLPEKKKGGRATKMSSICACGNNGYTNLVENRHFKKCPCFDGKDIKPLNF